MWYILDKNLETVGVLNTGASLDLKVLSDSMLSKLEQGYRSIEFTVDAKNDKAKLISEEGYIVAPNPNGINHYLFKITELETENNGVEKTLRCFGESAHIFDLNSDVVRPTAITGQTLNTVISNILEGTGWVLGDVDFNVSVSQSIDDYPTKLQTIFSLTEGIEDLEVDFVIDIRSGKISKKKVQLKKLDKSKKSLFTFGRNLSTLKRKINIEEIYSAVIPLGKGKDDSYLTLSEAIPNVTPPSGFSWIGQDGIAHNETRDRWRPGLGHRIFIYHVDDAQNFMDLYTKGLEKLKEIIEPKVEYSCDIQTLNSLGYSLEDFNKGDYVVIQDHEDDLYLQAVVSEKVTSETDPNSGSIVLSNYKKMNVKESKALLKIQQTLLKKEQDWNEAIEKAKEALEIVEGLDNFIAIQPIEPQHPEEDDLWLDTSSEPNLLKRWDGDQWVRAGAEGLPGPPGENGQTTYTWVKYADDSSGRNMSDSPEGKRYIGFAFNKMTQTESNVATDYMWSPLFDNVVVGGRNLQTDSAFKHKNLQRWNNYTKLTYTEDSPTNSVKVEKLITDTTTNYGFVTERKMKLYKDNTYTLSYEVRTSEDITMTYNYIMDDDEGNYSLGIVGDTVIGNGLWQKVSKTFTLPADRIDSGVLIATKYGTSFEVRNVKVEEGNVATSWTPAVEDIVEIKPQSTPPSNPSVDQLWLDTSAVPNQIYRWTGSAWATTSHQPQVKSSPTEPTNPKHNDMWLNTSSIPNTLFRYHDPNNDGEGEWVTTFNDVETIISAVAQSQEIETLFGKKADKEDLDVLATVDELNEKFNQADSKISDVETAVDNRINPLSEQIGEVTSEISALKGSLVLNFASKASGINLIKNSIGWANGYWFSEDSNGNIIKTRSIDFWKSGATVVDGYNIASPNQYANLTTLANEEYGSAWGCLNTSSRARAFQNVVGLKVGEKYTIGALFKKAISSSSYYGLVRVYEFKNGDYQQIGSAIGVGTGDAQSNDFKFSSLTFTAPAASVYIQIDILAPSPQDVQITSLMLNEGEVPYGWTMHNEELYSTGVSFNINGIKVSTGKNFTQMTSNEFAGYVLEGVSETPKRIFSLNGNTTEVANLEVEDTIRMGKIKIVKNSSGWSFMRN